ncbi:MAG: AraC family transcriptional regulator [Planctomycetota bacterium]
MEQDQLLAWIDEAREADWAGVRIHHCSITELSRWRSGRRKNDRHYVWLVVEGRMAGEVEAHRVELEPGDVQWLPPHREHAFSAVEEAGILGVYSLAFSLPSSSDAGALRGGGMPGLEAASRVRRGATQARALFGMLESAWRAMERPAGCAAFAGAMAQRRFHGLLVALLAEVASAPPAVDASPLDSAMRDRLERYADRHMREGVSPTDLAAHSGLSPDYFSRLFCKAYGEPPRQWLVGRRLDMARLMLRESALSVKEIAVACGYRDQRLLARQFRERFGVTPTEGRRQSRL